MRWHAIFLLTILYMALAVEAIPQCDSHITFNVINPPNPNVSQYFEPTLDETYDDCIIDWLMFNENPCYDLYDNATISYSKNMFSYADGPQPLFPDGPGTYNWIFKSYVPGNQYFNVTLVNETSSCILNTSVYIEYPPQCPDDLVAYFEPNVSIFCGENQRYYTLDTTPDCDFPFDSFCWQGYSNVTISLPPELSTIDPATQNLETVINNYGWDIDCNANGTYTANVTFVNDTSSCYISAYVDLSVQEQDPGVQFVFPFIPNITIGQNYSFNATLNNTGGGNVTNVLGQINYSFSGYVTYGNSTFYVPFIGNGTSANATFTITGVASGSLTLNLYSGEMIYYDDDGIFSGYANTSASNTFYVTSAPTPTPTPTPAPIIDIACDPDLTLSAQYVGLNVSCPNLATIRITDNCTAFPPPGDCWSMYNTSTLSLPYNIETTDNITKTLNTVTAAYTWNVDCTSPRNTTVTLTLENSTHRCTLSDDLGLSDTRNDALEINVCPSTMGRMISLVWIILLLLAIALGAYIYRITFIAFMAGFAIAWCGTVFVGCHRILGGIIIIIGIYFMVDALWRFLFGEYVKR